MVSLHERPPMQRTRHQTQEAKFNSLAQGSFARTLQITNLSFPTQSIEESGHIPPTAAGIIGASAALATAELLKVATGGVSTAQAQDLYDVPSPPGIHALLPAENSRDVYNNKIVGRPQKNVALAHRGTENKLEQKPSLDTWIPITPTLEIVGTSNESEVTPQVILGSTEVLDANGNMIKNFTVVVFNADTTNKIVLYGSDVVDGKATKHRLLSEIPNLPNNYNFLVIGDIGNVNNGNALIIVGSVEGRDAPNAATAIYISYDQGKTIKAVPAEDTSGRAPYTITRGAGMRVLSLPGVDNTALIATGSHKDEPGVHILIADPQTKTEKLISTDVKGNITNLVILSVDQQKREVQLAHTDGSQFGYFIDTVNLDTGNATQTKMMAGVDVMYAINGYKDPLTGDVHVLSAGIFNQEIYDQNLTDGSYTTLPIYSVLDKQQGLPPDYQNGTIDVRSLHPIIKDGKVYITAVGNYYPGGVGGRAMDFTYKAGTHPDTNPSDVLGFDSLAPDHRSDITYSKDARLVKINGVLGIKMRMARFAQAFRPLYNGIVDSRNPNFFMNKGIGDTPPPTPTATPTLTPRPTNTPTPTPTPFRRFIPLVVKAKQLISGGW